MAKLVITKNRDTEEPTLFLGSEGKFYSVSNKKEFKNIADKVKVEYDVKKAAALVASIEDWTNVRINIEMDPIEFFDYISK